MFKPQFAGLVSSGAKLQTVRPIPSRMPCAGDIFDAREWSGRPYASPQRKLIEARITKVETVQIDSAGVLVVEGCVLSPCDQYAFVVADGFGSRDEFELWFREQHGLPFDGIVIYWQPELSE